MRKNESQIAKRKTKMRLAQSKYREKGMAARRLLAALWIRIDWAKMAPDIQELGRRVKEIIGIALILSLAACLTGCAGLDLSPRQEERAAVLRWHQEHPEVAWRPE